MEKINIRNISTIELIHLESAVRLLYSQSENEYIAFRNQLSPSGRRTYSDTLKEMEDEVMKYSRIRRNIINELAIRVQNIDFEDNEEVNNETVDEEVNNETVNEEVNNETVNEEGENKNGEIEKEC
jgi:hypothetical protein